MPPVTRWFVKLALVYFVAALAVGVWQAAGGALWLTPVYIHLLVVGWITGMIFGVAYWMFPKYSKDQPRGIDGLAVTSFVLLNVGLLLRLIGEPLLAVRPSPGAGRVLLISGICQWLAGMAFIANTWPRVKER
ncbi:MAG TPA: hypothetical protein VMH88_11155 [Gemmatimonadales bacterium]|nr:hypothetical protein [Gemmatimonadales bacterium]